MINKIRFEYDNRSFKKSSVNELKQFVAENDEMSTRIIKQKSLALYPLLLIIIGAPFFWFSKGFFTKMGEDGYEKAKKKISNVLLNRNCEKPPLIGVKLSDSPTVVLYLKSDDEQAISKFLDSIRAHYKQIREYLKNIEENINKFVVTLNADGRHIEDCYYTTNTNEVFSMLRNSRNEKL